MVIGYFNTVSSHDEKSGGNPINMNEVNDFNTMISRVYQIVAFVEVNTLV